MPAAQLAGKRHLEPAPPPGCVPSGRWPLLPAAAAPAEQLLPLLLLMLMLAFLLVLPQTTALSASAFLLATEHPELCSSSAGGWRVFPACMLALLQQLQSGLGQASQQVPTLPCAAGSRAPGGCSGRRHRGLAVLGSAPHVPPDAFRVGVFIL